MTKIGIVSSFDVLCGNAKYSEILVKNISKDLECIPIDIPSEIQKYHNKNTINNIIKKINDCDAINIQMEIGLYGPTPKKSLNLICQIIQSTKKPSITMHRVDPQIKNLIRVAYNEYKNNGLVAAGRAALKEYIKKQLYRIYKKIVDYGVSNDACFIVHTNREKKRIMAINSNAKICVHPILWPDDLPYDNKKDIVEKKITKKNPTIGLFGFISHYKNFIQPTRAILNARYNLVIAGGIHPEAQEYGKKSLHSNIKLLDKELGMRTSNRRRFYIKIAPDDSTLLSLIQLVDIVLIPYFETGQSGSGIASLAIQYGKRVIFSDTCLTKELEAFLNKATNKFDINSDESLICSIEETIMEEEKNIYFPNHNFQSNIKTYLYSLGIKR